MVVDRLMSWLELVLHVMQMAVEGRIVKCL